MIEKAILKEYNSTNHTASVQLVGSLTTYFDDVRVARNIQDADMVIDRHVFIAISENNPSNAVIIAVFDP